ncbi:DUF1877 family protein [Aestuariimicrobium soli]|uniref:DUF1877 family protein n=1 Tax=Aestuariimicrobium soli TaxID=2035834 RepID=UPI003EBE776E
MLFEALLPKGGALRWAVSGGEEISDDILGLGGWQLLTAEQVANIASALHELDPQDLADGADPKQLASAGILPYGRRWTRRRVMEVFSEECFAFVDFYRWAAHNRALIIHLMA